MGECMSKQNQQPKRRPLPQPMGNSSNKNENANSSQRDNQREPVEHQPISAANYVLNGRRKPNSVEQNSSNIAANENSFQGTRPMGSNWNTDNSFTNQNSLERKKSDERKLNPRHETSSKHGKSDESEQNPRHNPSNERSSQLPGQYDPKQYSNPKSSGGNSYQQQKSHEPHRSSRFEEEAENSSGGAAKDIPTEAEQSEMDLAFVNDEFFEKISTGTKFETIISRHPFPPPVEDMREFQDLNSFFMIKPFKYDKFHPAREPEPINDKISYKGRSDENYVCMPYSKSYKTKNNQPMWPFICKWLEHLKGQCSSGSVTFHDLKSTIESCNGFNYDMTSLEKLIERIYSKHEREQFMFITLSKLCDLVLHLPDICTEPPPLLRSGMSQSVTMSQRQAASLLACSFFCLFPETSDPTKNKQPQRYPNPNFDRLYQKGPPEKIEKLKCLLHYFQRVTEQMPNGVITIQRYALPRDLYPQWQESKANLCEIHMTTCLKIEEVKNALQVDFANKYIGGGVLGNGCVQEEIRFSICPEMLVSLIVCEVMEKNESIFLIGCERFSSYKGYAQSFKFAGNFDDSQTPKDEWGRKACHLVAIDAIYFRDKTTQYSMKNVERELLKAYTGFRPLQKGSDHAFAIATGNWGCGAFNGDRQLKAIIQVMAASEAERELVYAAFGDKDLVNSFAALYRSLMEKNVTVGDLYYCLHDYSRRTNDIPLFDFILKKLMSDQKSNF